MTGRIVGAVHPCAELLDVRQMSLSRQVALGDPRITLADLAAPAALVDVPWLEEKPFRQPPNPGRQRSLSHAAEDLWGQGLGPAPGV